MIPPNLTSSPGGIALQDYHWSGGFYSPRFVSYDKWGQSLPTDLYGFNASVSEMIPSKTYQNQVQQFPIESKNYELLESLPIPQSSLVLPPPTQEHFSTSFVRRYQNLLLLILALLIVYFFDKTFGRSIETSTIWFKISILIGLFMAFYAVIIAEPM